MKRLREETGKAKPSKKLNRSVPRARATRKAISRRASRTSKMQIPLTRKLRARVPKYVDRELEIEDIRQKVRGQVTGDASCPGEEQMFQTLKKHICGYIQALLSYREKQCDAYADGADRTLTEPLTTLPQKSGLLNVLKLQFGLPTPFQKDLESNEEMSLCWFFAALPL